MIDEARKLVTVVHISDTKSFTGVWRGTYYECRAIPDTSSLVVGSVVYCHVVPGSTQLVSIAIPTGINLIVIWSGAVVDIPVGWSLCDGTNGTPNLVDKFILATVSASGDLGATGGQVNYDLTHSHTMDNWDDSNPYYRSGGESVPWHGHDEAINKYNSLDAYPHSSWITPLNTAGNPAHIHTITETPQDTIVDHFHGIEGTTGNYVGNLDILPKYYAKAYIMSSTMYDLPINGVAMTTGDPALLPAGYFECNGANGTPALQGYFLIGAGDDVPLGGTAGYGVYGYHTHLIPKESILSVNSDHVHTIAIQGYWSSDSTADHEIISGFPAGALNSPHHHKINVVGGQSLESGGAHLHELSEPPPYWRMTFQDYMSLVSIIPPYYKLYFVQRKV